MARTRSPLRKIQTVSSQEQTELPDLTFDFDVKLLSAIENLICLLENSQSSYLHDQRQKVSAKCLELIVHLKKIVESDIKYIENEEYGHEEDQNKVTDSDEKELEEVENEEVNIEEVDKKESAEAEKEELETEASPRKKAKKSSKFEV